MGVRANASKLKKKIARLSQATETVSTTTMRQSALDVVDRIETELASSDTSRQVGFNPAQFIRQLRLTLRQDEQGAWTVDPWEAGGDQSDLDLIAGESAYINGREQSLWHEGKGRTDSFFRLIYNNADARRQMASARQSVWGETTPQWYLINYGSTVGAQPAEHFLERALLSTPVAILKTRIKRELQEAWND